MDTNIIKYFRMCAISAPRIHPVASLDDVISNYEKQLYFMNSKGALIPKETVIGGWSDVSTRNKIVLFLT